MTRRTRPLIWTFTLGRVTQITDTKCELGLGQCQRQIRGLPSRANFIVRT